MYTKVDRIPDFPQMELRLLEFWKKTNAFEKLRAKNRGGPKWSFLDGPITANNPMGVHHAWGRSLKDMYQRYHAMLGQELRYQNGFDCQGLWVEVEVEKELGFTSKDDIAEYGIGRFVEKCKERVKKFSAIQTEQSIRLGYWMDWSDSYFTMADDNNYAIWSFLKRCHERGFVYRGMDSMPWCPRCGVGLSQMEMHEGYVEVKSPSVIIRLPLRAREKEALLIWTTTPWTLTSNVAAAVNPKMDYRRIRQGEWTYYVGVENWANDRRRDSDGKQTGLRNLPELIETGGPVELLDTVSGASLIGLEYGGPFDELPAQSERGGFPFPNDQLLDRNGIDCHKVIEWDQITGTEGTGIVHIAPGCGREDYELSKELGLVAIAPLDERGKYVEGFDWLMGKSATDVAEEVSKNLKEKQILIAREKYPHSYPHCWRCKTPVLFRLVDEWYIDMKWRDEISKTVHDVKWIPDFGRERELDWLRNMRDWMISKKRYWGLALPIWVCEDEECETFDVIGGKDELRERAIAGWDEFDGNSPHRPYVDNVIIECKKCGGTAKRIPDVGNPWLDAGIVPYSTMGYNSDREHWKEWFPADLVLECFPGQFRNWFYALLAMSAMMEGVAPFKTLLGHSLVRDEYGEEMHKSQDNSIEFNHAAQQIGAEIMRYIFAGQNPVSNLNFPDLQRRKNNKKRHLDVEIRRKLLTFWNCYSFYVQYAELDNVRPGQFDIPPAERSQLDRWVLSRLQHLIKHARTCFEENQLHLLIGRWEHFIEDDLSNWYLRRSRRRFWKSESDLDKQAAYATLYDVLHACIRLMAPVLPFLAEEVYQNIVRSVDTEAPISIHHLDYPECDDSLIDEHLEVSIAAVIRYKNLGLGLRNTHNLKVRQPLARIWIKPENEAEKAALLQPDLAAVLKEELNIKEIELIEDESTLITTSLKANFASLGPKYGRYMKQLAKIVPGLDPAELRQKLAQDGYSLEVDGETLLLESDDFLLEHECPEGRAFAFDGDAFAALETTISDELALEGAARDFVRHTQNLRKDRGLKIEARIHLTYRAEGKSAAALEQWADYIKGETLALSFAPDPTLDEQNAKTIKLGGASVLVDLKEA